MKEEGSSPFDEAESNPEQDLADIERTFENAKADRNAAELQFDKMKARYHMELVARREAGKKMTIPDMQAMEIVAIDDISYVRDAYIAYIKADAHFRDAKVKFEEAKRNYWDGKDIKNRERFGAFK